MQALMYAPLITETVLSSQSDMQSFIDKLTVDLNVDVATTYYEIELHQDTERHWWLPKISVTSHGVKHNIMINKDLFISPDYKRLAEFGNLLNQLIKPGAHVERDGKKHTISNFAQAVEWLLAEAKKGQSIQRYKGLGEMNPDQLWETTMDPDKRVLLQVKVEDAVAADQIFTTLMGDEVEPRRKFIESNALEVINLDI